MRFLKIQQLLILSILLFMFGMNGVAQYKSFQLTADGDTINAITKDGVRQGKSVIHVDELRGEPGYEEEGVYVKGNKEGIWRRYSLTGDIIAVEFYKLGGKHGLQQYYTFLGDLIREESWRGYDPDAPYDTIAVYGPGNGEIIDYKIVKAEQYSVKDGEWKYYEAGSGILVKTEVYDRGHIVTPGVPAIKVAALTDKPKKPEKTAEMLEWEKKNKGKKKVIRDGRTVL